MNRICQQKFYLKRHSPVKLHPEPLSHKHLFVIKHDNQTAKNHRDEKIEAKSNELILLNGLMLRRNPTNYVVVQTLLQHYSY